MRPRPAGAAHRCLRSSLEHCDEAAVVGGHPGEFAPQLTLRLALLLDVFLEGGHLCGGGGEGRPRDGEVGGERDDAGLRVARAWSGGEAKVGSACVSVPGGGRRGWEGGQCSHVCGVGAGLVADDILLHRLRICGNRHAQSEQSGEHVVVILRKHRYDCADQKKDHSSAR